MKKWYGIATKTKPASSEKLKFKTGQIKSKTEITEQSSQPTKSSRQIRCTEAAKSKKLNLKKQKKSLGFRRQQICCGHKKNGRERDRINSKRLILRQTRRSKSVLRKQADEFQKDEN